MVFTLEPPRQVFFLGRPRPFLGVGMLIELMSGISSSSSPPPWPCRIIVLHAQLGPWRRTTHAQGGKLKVEKLQNPPGASTASQYSTEFSCL